MVFLIHYDKLLCRLHYPVVEYADKDYHDARAVMLQIMLAYYFMNSARYEVTILQADSIEDIKITHSRYFKGS